VERRGPIFCLKINVTARCNELFCNSCVAIGLRGCGVYRCESILSLKIDVTARNNQLLYDGRMLIAGREVERRVPIRALVVDEGLRAFCRQQRANLRCVTNKRGLAKLQPRHSFPETSLCFFRVYLQLVWT
jgi:hypothetical protein